MPDVTACEPCEIATSLQRDGRSFRIEGTGWSLNDNVETAARPRLVLQLDAHRADVSELSQAESTALGQLISQVSAALRRSTGAARVYTLLLNEAGHVHVHFWPRYESDPAKQRGPHLDLTWPGPEGHQLVAEQIAAEVNALRRAARVKPPEPSPLVRGVVRALLAVQKIGPYELIRRWVRPAARAGSRWAELYVPLWVGIWAALLLLPAPAVLKWVGTGALAWRAVDLVSLHMLTLLDRRRQVLASAPRSLLLLAFNVAEVCLGAALALRYLGIARSAAVRSAFQAVTLNGWSDARRAVELVLGGTTVVAVVLMTVALGTVVSVISQNYREADAD